VPRIPDNSPVKRTGVQSDAAPPDPAEIAGRTPLGTGTFRFRCSPAVSCFTRCCHDVRIDLRPYDLVRLKKALTVSSSDVLASHTYVTAGENPGFPAVRLAMSPAEGKPCPFLRPEGCRVYEDRPDACRTYPLERGVSVEPGRPTSIKEYYFLARQPICRGHDEDREWTVREWIRDQGVEEYNRMNNLWAELDLLFRANPGVWGRDGWNGSSFRMAFMALYDVDRFRDFVFESSFLKRYRIKKDVVRTIKRDDTGLLRFGHAWVKATVFHIPTPLIRQKTPPPAR